MEALHKSTTSLPSLIRREWMLLASYATTAAFMIQGNSWLGTNPGPSFGWVLFIWLFVVMLSSSFAVVRHADHLAELLREPLGTIILTLAVTSIEVMMISALMLNGNNPALARDTMFSVVMVVLGGLLALALLTGGLRFGEQNFNLKGVNSFLGLILPLSVLSLVLPNFTRTGGDGMFSTLHAISLIALSLIIYGVFLAVQTSRHREFFNETESVAPAATAAPQAHGSVTKESLLLILHLVPVVLLSKQLAHLLDYRVHAGGLPQELVGLVVAILILAPEGLAAIQAAARNQMQRSVNVLLGSVLATISLTVPAALAISLLSGKPVLLGLSPPYMTLLAVTLGSCIITFAQGQTNILQGFVHLLLFAAYIVLMFD
ncbi:MAG: calcium:proton antiporter [Verrucomicrobia bacterium]|nr:calcium:proton antiporter [Verrucomicrobiota bacterium]